MITILVCLNLQVWRLNLCQLNLTGDGYDPTVDNDVLLLDIGSDDDEYTWTNIFDPSATRASKASEASNSKASKKSIVIYIVVGVVVGVVLLLVGGFILYKWKKSKKRQADALSTPEKWLNFRITDELINRNSNN